ncbi:hypothetical protein AUP68_09901 [Ilyonectria robusta]
MSQPTGKMPSGKKALNKKALNKKAKDTPPSPASSFNPSASALPPAAAPSLKTRNSHTPAAMLIDGPDDRLFGGKTLGVDTDITMTMVVYRPTDTNPWKGFSVEFPFGATNEESGFGMSHKIDRQGSYQPIPTTALRLSVEFPRDLAYFEFEPIDDGRRELIAKPVGEMSVVKVYLKEGAEVDVEGFGLPFANPGHPAEAWLEYPDIAPVVGTKTLLSILLQRQFTFIVSLSVGDTKAQLLVDLPEPFSYPFGTEHSWDIERYPKQVHGNKVPSYRVWLSLGSFTNESKGKQFLAGWSYDDDNSHLAAVTQSQVQDVFWLHEASVAIKEHLLPAYFVKKPSASGQARRYYAIIRLTFDFKGRYDAAW